MSGNWMQTYTGKAVDPLAAEPDSIDPIDIAHALSLLCRYNGHVDRFYSVAEHCVIMSNAVAPEHALWALMHDATEAYVGDMIRPLKLNMPAYRAAEHHLMRVIAERFGMRSACPIEVKKADIQILVDERNALMKAPPMPWFGGDQVLPLGVPITGWAPQFAEKAWLTRFEELAVTTSLANELGRP